MCCFTALSRSDMRKSITTSIRISSISGCNVAIMRKNWRHAADRYPIVGRCIINTTMISTMEKRSIHLNEPSGGSTSLRSTFNGSIGPVHHGWLASADRPPAVAYHTALDILEALQHRLRYVLIDCRDFAEVLRSYESQRTLFYVDPPYIEKEDYYQREDGTVFSLFDHKRLAVLLNETPALVALSYYPHPLLDELYPTHKWRRVTWKTVKHSQRSSETRERATELLLCNYPEPIVSSSLWSEVEAPF